MIQGEYANVNGLTLYYEIHGKGQPLILLHGGLGTVGMFAQLLPALAENRQAIAVELQGHGHTADINRPLSFEQMADDIAAVIEHLGLDNADILGYSLGGGVALQTAIRHPELVRKLVVVSAPCKSDGWYPEVRTGMRSMNAQAAQAMIGSPMHQAYVSVAPKPEAWPELVTRLGQLVGQDYDWSKGDPAWHDALRHLFLPNAYVHCYAVPRRADARCQIDCVFEQEKRLTTEKRPDEDLPGGRVFRYTLQRESSRRVHPGPSSRR